MKEKTCCFTGHRMIPANEYFKIKKHLETEIIHLIHQGVRYFGSGGALGFDTMAALAVLKLREEYPQMRLILVLPCKEQTREWKEEDIKIYNQILEKADKAVYTSEHYYKGWLYAKTQSAFG